MSNKTLEKVSQEEFCKWQRGPNVHVNTRWQDVWNACLARMTPIIEQRERGRFGTAEQLAERMHYIYERLAPDFGYTTRKESAKPWSDIPDKNKQLMIAVCAEILAGKLEDEK